jgi:hypothetical protein
VTPSGDWAAALPRAAATGTGLYVTYDRERRAAHASALAGAGAATYPVGGTMKRIDGSPQADFWITAGWYDPDGYSWFVPDALYHSGGDGTTGADGSFSFKDVPSHPGHDSLMTGSMTGKGGYRLSAAASHNTIMRGQSVRLRGHIDAKKATLFMRQNRAGQPASTKAKGWTKVADITASHGRFLSAQLRPARTTWYVVRYHGTNGGFSAFTPVVKAAVR